jgi:hypothetical protein
MSQAMPRQPSPVIVRAAVWSLIGMIYAPLYLMLNEMLAPALGAWSGVLAATLAGGIGAAFYGARQLALTASVIGTVCGLAAIGLLDPHVAHWGMTLAALCASIAVGLLVRFPDRCTAEVGVKVLAGLVGGAVAGSLLLLLTAVLGLRLPQAAGVSLLVAVTGVLYVALLVQRPVRRVCRGRYCDLVEGLVIAVIAVITANGLAALAGIVAEGTPGALTPVLMRAVDVMPQAVTSAMVAGAVAGGLLELFEFDWVDRA